ncbi:hypothetical protein [Nostoc sp. NIES-3756]|nr:hypothetical protein [Nostoc sp. NIES-3756]
MLLAVAARLARAEKFLILNFELITPSSLSTSSKPLTLRSPKLIS